jgi:tRNA threonylcarbamoyladenosine biosynthesis protein TsaB
MKTLAIDSTGQVVTAAIAEAILPGSASIAAAAEVAAATDPAGPVAVSVAALPGKNPTDARWNPKVLAEMYLNVEQNHSVTLMPMIDQLLNLSGVKLRDIGCIACASGPGSFTGLRIGAAAAKALAFAGDMRIAPVPTLDALAYNAFDTNSIIAPLMDARRGQVYTAFYEWREEVLVRLTDYQALDISETAARLAQYQKPVTFLGDGASVYREAILSDTALTAAFVPANLNLQHASAVACLGFAKVLYGKTVSSGEFAPFYLRLSQAERERLERLKLEPTREAMTVPPLNIK